MIKNRAYIFAVVLAMLFGFLIIDNAEAKYTESKTLTVSLKIEKHYEVAFNANGGVGTMDNQEFTSGTPQALAANTFTRDGYYFAGWNTNADGSGTEYADGENIDTDITNIGGEVVDLYAQWEEDSMHTVFKIDGTCVFHGYQLQSNTGDGYITGTNCVSGDIDWADGTHRYIDSGVKLYNSTNYGKDFEVGFTVTAYDSDHQYKESSDTAAQSTFFSAKLENSARHWPGIVARKSKNLVEVTETITKPNGTNEKKTGTVEGIAPLKVAIIRVEGVVYYSFNDGSFTQLQNLNGTSDYFDVNAWFGAAAKDNGEPMRYIDATMTDIYIKIGDTGANKHTVSFDAGGVVSNPANVSIVGTSKIGSSLPGLPNYVDTADGRLYFMGWYSGLDGAGDKYDENSVISRDITLHAYWSDELRICSIGDVTHGDLQSCINEASAGDTIALLEDLRAQVEIPAGKDIILDLNGHRLGDNSVAGMPVIENFGKLTVLNGTITSSLRAGVLNNNTTGEMYIGNDARIIATGPRQAIYNKGGKLEISGNAYLSATSGERPAVQSLENGTLVIKGGTIISTQQEAVKVESGSATIGVENGVADRSTPILQGATTGLNTSVNVSMFDGTLRGKSAAINDTSRLTASEVGATSVGIDSVVTEVVDGVTYKIIYYQ